MDFNARTAAFVLGIVLLIAGVLGYIPNPLVGHMSDGTPALFLTNNLHNLVHIASGIFLLIGVYTSLGSSMALKILGIVYAIVAILGFVLPMPDGMMFGVLLMNQADNWLHVVLAIVLLAAGFALPTMRTARI